LAPAKRLLALLLTLRSGHLGFRRLPYCLRQIMILLSSLHCTRFTRAFPTGRARFLSQAAAAELREHFTFIPKFLAASEQTVLLSASLKKLNEAESGSIRRRRRRHESTLSDSARQTFLPDEYYQFEEVRDISLPIKVTE
jgi:hypothetical protein